MSLGHIPVSIDTKCDIGKKVNVPRYIYTYIQEQDAASYEPILVTKSQIKSPASEGGENLQYTETSVLGRNVGS